MIELPNSQIDRVEGLFALTNDPDTDTIEVDTDMTEEELYSFLDKIDSDYVLEIREDEVNVLLNSKIDEVLSHKLGCSLKNLHTELKLITATVTAPPKDMGLEEITFLKEIANIIATKNGTDIDHDYFMALFDEIDVTKLKTSRMNTIRKKFEK